MALHLSVVRVCHHDTPVHTEDTTSSQMSPSRLQVASLREVLSVARTNAHLSMWNLPERHEHLSVARWRVADLPRKRTRIRWPFAFLVCVSVTTTRPCPPRTRHHCGHRRRRGAYLRVTTRTDSRNKCVTRLEVNIQAHVRVNVHASLYCLVGFRIMFASTPWQIQAGWKMLQTQRHLTCFEKMSTYSFNVLASSSEDAASFEPSSSSCREDRFRHPCCDHMDECAFQGSVVVRRGVSVSMCSFCFFFPQTA